MKPFFLWAILGGWLLASQAAADASTLRTVALSGDPVPGVEGAFFSRLSALVLNDKGRTAFLGRLSTPEGEEHSAEWGVWSEGIGNGLATLARGGIPAPGAGGARFSEFGQPSLSNSGQTVFFASLPGTPLTTPARIGGIWQAAPDGELSLAARTGEPAAGYVGTNFADFHFDPSVNDAGYVVFTAATLDSDAYRGGGGIWAGQADEELQLVAGRATTSLENNKVLGFQFVSDPSVNETGRLAFEASLIVSEDPSSEEHGIWAGEIGGSLSLVVQLGAEVPNMSGVSFHTFGNPVLNNAGQMVFRAVLRGSGVNGANDNAIWTSSADGDLELVTREGNPAPGIPDADFSGFWDPVLNGIGQTAFTGFLRGDGVAPGSNMGIWSEGIESDLRLVARLGDPAPGTSDAFFTSLGAPILNKQGQTAFTGNLGGDDADFDNNSGIWAEDLTGTVHLIARTGDQLDVDDGPGVDLRTISRLGIARKHGLSSIGSGNEDGAPSSFNDLGQLAFVALFTDGTSGVFVSNLVATIPEPTTCVLAVVAIGCVACRRSPAVHSGTT